MSIASADVGGAPRRGGKQQPALPGLGKYRRSCPECLGNFDTDNPDRMFCTDAHKAAFHNRSSKIGRSLVPLAQAWRLGRNAKGKSPEALARRASAAKAFAEMCAIIDAANSEDLSSKRQDKLSYIRDRTRRAGTFRKEETAQFHQQQAAKAAKGGQA